MNQQNLFKNFHLNLNSDDYITSYNIARRCNVVFAEVLTHQQFDDLGIKNLDHKIIKYTENFVIYRLNSFDLNDGDLIFCKTDFILDLFAVLRKAKKFKKISILTHQSAKPSIDKSLFSLKPSCVVSWYSINIIYETENLIPIPLGLANDYSSSNILPKDYKDYFKTNNISSDKNLVMLNFNPETNIDAREKLKNYFETIDWVNYSSNLTKNSYIKQLSHSNFVFSPPGWGLDTHRFWESLYFGVVPIINSTYDYSKLHINNYLQYKNFKEITEQKLNKFLDEKIDMNLNTLSVLTLDWWFQNVIKSHNLQSNTKSLKYSNLDKLYKRIIKK